MRQLKNSIPEKEEHNIKIESKRDKTTLEHIERIVENVENSGLNQEFFRETEKDIHFVAMKMGLTTTQAVLFAIFIEKSDDSRIHISGFTKLIGCRLVKIISLMSDIDELEKRHLVRCNRNESQKSYRVPMDVINALKQDIPYTPESTQNLTTKALFKHIDRLFTERANGEISYDLLLTELRALIEHNSSLRFCKQIKAYEKLYRDPSIFLLLITFCHRFINIDDDYLSFYDFEYIYDDRWIFQNIKSNLKNNRCELIKNNILEYSNENGFGNRDYFKLSDSAKEKLFVELDIKIQQADERKDLISFNKITAKELFYNEKERLQIDQLSSLLSQKNFISIQRKLAKNGMRKGFACLFYGAPGTGKTETAYQIARLTGRDIMIVDIAEVKSMWYGESEKRIKSIFDTYRAYLKTCKVAPILLFDEADAIISKRKEAGTDLTNQTENAIQNILLQEMENLEGILIATTNLTQNLDRAFERRFLYKIEFEKPDIRAKEKIWNTMLPTLSESEREELAKVYSFSGGQIENIVRKYTIDSILNNAKPSLDTIHLYCQSEYLDKTDAHKRVGFTN